jgi:hypothetical protein
MAKTVKHGGDKIDRDRTEEEQESWGAEAGRHDERSRLGHEHAHKPRRARDNENHGDQIGNAQTDAETGEHVHGVDVDEQDASFSEKYRKKMAKVRAKFDRTEVAPHPLNDVDTKSRGQKV